jgi:hypothetical protein
MLELLTIVEMLQFKNMLERLDNTEGANIKLAFELVR